MRKWIGTLAAVLFGAAIATAVAVGAVTLLATGGGGSSGTADESAAAADTGQGDETQNLSLSSEECSSAADIYESARPAVVEITVTLGSNGPFGQQGQAAGTGVVIDEEGHILTNNHVINGADAVEVRFSDGSTLPAEIIGTDPANDLAIIEVDPEAHDLVVAELGDSDALRVGDPVLAIGNPFQLEGTLTQGIVSAIDRTYSSGANTRPIREMIQTDAAVNPGNSGGPLLNCYGEVIGINTLLENPTGQNVNVGIAFAVAINTAKRSLSDLIAGQSVDHPWLGIAGVDVTPAVAEELDLGVDSGVYVTLVSQSSPADDAGLQAAFNSETAAANSDDLPPGGDVIVAVEGQDVTSIDELATYLDENHQPGDVVELTVVRDGEELTVDAQLADWPG